MKIRELRRMIGIDTYTSLEKLERLNLELPLYVDAHSWAGSKGQTARVFKTNKNNEVIALNSGGWYSANGRITEEKPDVPLGQELKRIVSDLEKGDIVILKDWNNYNSPPKEYIQFWYHVLSDEDLIEIQGVNLPEDQEV